MAKKRQQTGASDPTYDLVSTLYHALQGAEFSMRAQEDARRAGDSELVALFESAQKMQRELAERARALLGERMGAMVQGPREPVAGARARGGAVRRGAAVHRGPESDMASAGMPPRNLEHRERDASGRRVVDVVDEASMESFPASDAPAY